MLYLKILKDLPASKKLVTQCLILLFPHLLVAQTGGEYIYQFLNTPTSARQTALGGKVLTLTDDVNQPTWNPATINQNLSKQLSVNYVSYLGGINIGSASYAQKINRRLGTLQGNIKYINYGTLISANENGEETGNFNASDIAISIGYAKRINKSNFYLGANLKFVNSLIATYNSSGIAFDFSIFFYDKNKPYTATIVARNIGTQITSFNGYNEKLPFEITMGYSYRLKNVPLKWYATIDNLQKWKVGVPNPSNQTSDLEGNTTTEKISFLNNLFRHIIIGAELFPESPVNLRIGYNFRRGKELELQNIRTFGGISFGFGLKMNSLKFNYAYSKFHSASNVSTFSLQINLDKGQRGKKAIRY
ncbi:type IX secretion system protein PorQ [Tenacibaculum maritimum]|uniref:type IX secretion system protein PorQ n=1 Tax=Tenacibaculum maritimum TaxID=107401 RepID=UPI0012E462EF|nr:type IX secretion system protein PorQ [Tenacibaculum maritimum]CAA0210606.1 Por secretion system protein PorQ [Tenacibaculum maritimum]